MAQHIFNPHFQGRSGAGASLAGAAHLQGYHPFMKGMKSNIPAIHRNSRAYPCIQQMFDLLNHLIIITILFIGICIGVLDGISGRTAKDILSEFGGQGFGVFKPALADLCVSQIAPISKEMNKLLEQPEEIDRLLEKGAGQAKAIAAPILAEVKQLIGFSG